MDAPGYGIDPNPPLFSTLSPSTPSLSPPTPSLASVLSPEDEDMLFSVMNSNVPVEQGNFWFPSTHEGDLPALDAILSINTPNNSNNSAVPAQSRVERKKQQQSNASKRYRVKKKETTEQLTQENAYLQRELQLAQQQVTLLSQQIATLQSQLSQAQSLHISPNPSPPNPPPSDQNNLTEQIEITQKELQSTLQLLHSSVQNCLQQRVSMNATHDNPTLQTNNLKTHLDNAHRLILHHHDSLCALAQSVITPNTHAYWAIFEPPHSPAHQGPELVPSECVFEVADTNNVWWREYALSAQATPAQLSQISSLQRRYCQGIARIKKARFQYSTQVREFYWQRVYRIQFHFPGPNSSDTSPSTFQVTQVELLSKLQLLKHNIDEERTLLTETYNEISYALHPLQEALLLVKLFEEAQSHLDHFHSVHSIWEKMGGEVEGSHQEKNCEIM